MLFFFFIETMMENEEYEIKHIVDQNDGKTYVMIKNNITGYVEFMPVEQYYREVEHEEALDPALIVENGLVRERTKSDPVTPNEARPTYISERYLVTRNANVFSTMNERFLKPILFNNGYHHVNIHLGEGERKAALAHRLVATAFIPNPEDKEQVNHKSSVKIDNRESNLEWNTQTENLNHALANGLIPWASADQVTELSPEQISGIRDLAGTLSFREIGRRYGVNHHRISALVKGDVRTGLDPDYNPDENEISEMLSIGRYLTNRARAKLTTSDVEDIKRRRAGGERVVDIAESYGVNPKTIYNAVNGTCINYIE